MARFAAVVDWGTARDPRPELERAGRALTLGGSRESLFEVLCPGFGAFVAVHGDDPPVREAGGALVLSPGHGAQDEGDLEFLDAMAAWLRDGGATVPEAGRAPRGRRCLVRWDPARQELLVVGEANGLAPLYLCRERERVLLASEPKAIAAAAGEGLHVDADALLDLFTVGECLDGRTLFREVSALAPGAAMLLGPGRAVQREWYAPRFSEARGGDVHAAAAALNGALLEILAHEHRVHPRVTVALSGGMDSRYVLAGARQVWEGVEAITFGPPESADVLRARQVARQAGVPHRVVPWDAAALGRWAPFGVWRTDGMLSCVHYQGMDAMIAHADSARLVLNGMGGDFLTGAFLRPGYLVQPGAAARAAGTVLARYRFHSRTRREIFKPGLLRDCRTRPEASLAACMDRWRSPRLGNALLGFWTRQHAPRFTALGLALEAPFLEYATPLADPRFVAAAAPMSLELRFLGRAYRRALALLDRDLARVPCVRYGCAPARPLPLLALHGYARRLRRLRLPAPAPYAEEYRGPVRTWVRELLLDRETRADGFFLPAYLETLIAGQAGGQGERAGELAMALSLELWRRMSLAGHDELARPPVELPAPAPPRRLSAGQALEASPRP